jgi:predicted HicB family RNase H-like nuclease
MKRPGRPPLARDDASVAMSFRMPAKQYDLAQKQATEARMSLSEWLRRVVTRTVRERSR